MFILGLSIGITESGIAFDRVWLGYIFLLNTGIIFDEE